MKKRRRPEDIARKVIRSYLHEHSDIGDAASINYGDCDEFAEILSSWLPGSQVLYVMPADDDDDGWSRLTHFWVEHQGKHYDAECPQGVPLPELLPVFMRWGIADLATAGYEIYAG